VASTITPGTVATGAEHKEWVRMSIGLRWLGLFLLLWCASACLVEGATLGEGDMQLSALIGSGKELWRLTDPVEDDLNHKWSEFEEFQ